MSSVSISTPADRQRGCAWPATAALAAGLATAAPAQADPLEPFNRAMFTFNTYAVDHVIDPLAQFSQAWIPQPLRTAGSNVYENLTEPEFIVAHVLAGDNGAATASIGRLAVNSTLGLGGLFDVAGRFGIDRTPIEFGEALCAAGVPTGDYVVLPLVGPSNVVTAASVSVFIVGGYYVLSLLSTALATADLIVDFSASAASLRHADDMPDRQARDAYAVQRADYLSYLTTACPAPRVAADGRTAPQAAP